MARIEVPGLDIAGLRAANPGPFTLQGTNSWLVGREPTWLVDPGPALPDHLTALADEIERRSGLGGIALTHDHADHAEAVASIRDRYPNAPLGAARGAADELLGEGSVFGPLEAVATPGHSRDHLAYISEGAALTGDAVLGEGSVFVAPYAGALAAYLEGLERLRARQPSVLCPGHGPVVDDPMGKLEAYIAHRRERELRLVAALDAGKRHVDELLDEVWDDVPEALRFPAAITLEAHLDKLEQEGRLPTGVERPDLGAISWI
jgi:glyoxylase-like metal-dependent hydrolase (beta-lactamase superfamily II)